MKRKERRGFGHRVSTTATLFLVVTAGCFYVPARFSAAPPVTTVRDDFPIPVPGQSTVPDELRYSQAYVEYAVVDAFDPRRISESEDVNALDEVPASSWFAGGVPTDSDYVRNGPPRLPLAEVASERKLPTGVRVFDDADGKRWEVVADEPGRSGMRAASGAITSRLVSLLGYYAAESYPVRLGGARLLAVRYPAARGALAGKEALDVGPTTALGTRIDDPNDVVDHTHRRSLRALGLVGAWLGLDEMRPQLLRDVYVGAPDVGFVQHQVVGLQDALVAGRLVGILHDTDADRPARNPWLALATLGFLPKEGAEGSATLTTSLGLFPEFVDPGAYDFAVPYPPALEAQPPDLYWIGKRIAAIPHSSIVAAISAGDIGPKTSAYLDRALLARRDSVARYAMSLVTPLEVTRLVAARASSSPEKSFGIDCQDLAVRQGFEAAANTTYYVDVLDDAGASLRETQTATPRGPALHVDLPAALLDEWGYLIVRIRAVRDGRAAPRSLELHVSGHGAAPVLRGVRH